MKNNCKPGSKNWRNIIGLGFLGVGAVLGILSNSDAALLGFFIAGSSLLCIKPRSGCSPCGGCGSCGCCCGCLPGKNSVSVMEANCSEPTFPVAKKAVKSVASKSRKTKKPA
jgi:hypothetical protein